MINKGNQKDIHMNTSIQSTQFHNTISEYSLEELTRNIEEVLVISDLAGNIVFITESIEQMLGYDKEQYFGAGWKELISEDTEEYITSNVQQHTNKNTFKIKMDHPTGKQILLRCIVNQVRMSGERFYVLTIKDVTRKKEVEELIIRAEKMSVAGQLAAGIVHEIRNPLTALKGFLQLLQSGVGDKDAYFRVMIDEIEKMNKITSELLYLSKPLTDLFNNHRLYEMVTDIITLFQPQASEKNITIVNKVDEKTIVYCDQTQIKQILINLIKNGLEEMTSPGEIVVISKVLEEFIQIDVIDEGDGIDVDIIDKINEPFFTTKSEGTGLGLMITKQILDYHNGYLEVFCNADIGTTFRLLLPKKAKI